MIESARPTVIAANPDQWSEKSKQSVAFGFRREYRDEPYNCWHCKAASLFTAQEQKYTFEVQKASINQSRILCEVCWQESNRIRAALRTCEEAWTLSKVELKTDEAFLGRWLQLLLQLEQYVPCKPDTAKRSMLSKLLAGAKTDGRKRDGGCDKSEK